VVRNSRYKGQALVKEFKKEMNGSIKHKLIEIEQPFSDIKEYFERTINLNKYWRESR